MKNIFFGLKVFFIMIALSSCSTMEFVADGGVNYRLSSLEGSEKMVTVEGVSPFYLWGNFPKVGRVNLNEIFKETEVKNPSMIKVERINTYETYFWTLLTLGLYMPEGYRVSVYSKGMHDEK